MTERNAALLETAVVAPTPTNPTALNPLTLRAAMWIQPASKVQPRAVAWLWPGRLALGKVALLEGDPDLGKSFVALDLCARLSTNRPMPDGSFGPGPANSLYLFVEDGGGDTIRPRLTSLGADLDRVFLPDDASDMPLSASAAAAKPTSAKATPDRCWSLPRDLPRLKESLDHCQPRLVVLDPVMAFLDATVQSHNEQSLRRLLTPLKALAEERQCAILPLRHLNKTVGMRAQYRGSGSIAFSAACRAQWLVARLPDGDGRCILAQQKNNLAARQPSLIYEVRTGADGLPTLQWHGESDWTAQRVLNERHARRAVRLEAAMTFLRDFLKDGPRTSRQIWAAALKRGYKEITLRRAARKLELDFRSVWADDDRLSYWCLPGHLPPPPDPSTDLEPWLAPLRERYPAASPLDDCQH